MKLDDYIDAAKAKHDLISDNALNRFMGFSGNACHTWRTGKSLPTPDSMVALAEAAGLDPHLALADLGLWNAKKDGKDRLAAVYRDLKRIVKADADIAA